MSGNAGVLLLLPAGGPGSKQVEGCWRWVPAFGSIRTYEPERRSLDRRWGGNWLAREKCTSNNSHCWLLAACCLLHHQFAEFFLLYGFRNKLVIYLSSSVSNNSIRGLDFLVVDFLVLGFYSYCCLFVCFWVLQFVA